MAKEDSSRSQNIKARTEKLGEEKWDILEGPLYREGLGALGLEEAAEKEGAWGEPRREMGCISHMTTSIRKFSSCLSR